MLLCGNPVCGAPIAAQPYLVLPSGLLPQTGLFTLSGQAVSLLFVRKLIAEFGAFTLNGQDVNFILSISQESYLRILLVGSAAQFARGFTMITNFQMVAGDSKSLVVTVKDGAGLAVNITGATIKWRAARSFGKSAIISKSTASGIQITDGANGQFTVTLDPADTNSLLGVYYHEAEVTSTNNEISTVISGTMKINPNLIAS